MPTSHDFTLGFAHVFCDLVEYGWMDGSPPNIVKPTEVYPGRTPDDRRRRHVLLRMVNAGFAKPAEGAEVLPGVISAIELDRDALWDAYTEFNAAHERRHGQPFMMRWRRAKQTEGFERW